VPRDALRPMEQRGRWRRSTPPSGAVWPTATPADFLVTGDKRDLLGLGVYEGAKIVTVRDFLTYHGQP
jgi:hypothetical protein